MTRNELRHGCFEPPQSNRNHMVLLSQQFNLAGLVVQQLVDPVDSFIKAGNLALMDLSRFRTCVATFLNCWS